jgi:hypothetical protein
VFADIETDSKFLDDAYIDAMMIKSYYELKRRAFLTVMDTDITLTVYMKDGHYKTFIKIGRKPDPGH